jgi:thioredoxin-like negative regulator of GroEL
LIVAPKCLWGQEVKWRTDYNKARQESVDKKLPLFIDIGTTTCYWCKQLDAKTFVDHDLVKLLNERWIPLKIDAGENQFLAQSLRIQSYPTLVFAGTAGKILDFQEGFIEAGPLKEQLLRLAIQLVTPPWMTRDFDEAAKAVTAGKFPQALTLLKNIIEDGQDRDVQVKARKLVQDVEKKAAEQAARVKQLAETGKTSQAMEGIDSLERDYPGTSAASEGKRLRATLASRGEAGSAVRSQRSKELLAQAREDYKNQNYLWCLDRCELILSQFGDMPEGAGAAQLASEVKDNPEWTKKAAEQMSERLANLYLSLADSWLKKGQPQQAMFYLERIAQTFPNTRQAEIAQARLAQLRGAPTKGNPAAR